MPSHKQIARKRLKRAQQAAKQTSLISLEAENTAAPIIAVVVEFLRGAEVAPDTVNYVSFLLRGVLMPAALLLAKNNLVDVPQNEPLAEHTSTVKTVANSFGLTFLGLNLIVGEFSRTASGPAAVAAVLAIVAASGLKAYADHKILKKLDELDREVKMVMTPEAYQNLQKKIADEFSNCGSLTKLIGTSIASSIGTISGISALLAGITALISESAADTAVSYSTWPVIIATVLYSLAKATTDYRTASPSANHADQKQNAAYREKFAAFESALSGICWSALDIASTLGTTGPTLLAASMSWLLQAYTTGHAINTMRTDSDRMPDVENLNTQDNSIQAAAPVNNACLPSMAAWVKAKAGAWFSANPANQDEEVSQNRNDKRYGLC